MKKSFVFKSAYKGKTVHVGQIVLDANFLMAADVEKVAAQFPEILAFIEEVKPAK